jgi:hypothetical protein
VRPDFRGRARLKEPKTKADAGKWIEDAVSGPTTLIKDEDAAGLSLAVRSPFPADVVRTSTLGGEGIEDSGGPYRQLVACYYANDLVPPAPREGPCRVRAPAASAR